MGELIFHIDQKSGTVLKVEQKLDEEDKKGNVQYNDTAMQETISRFEEMAKEETDKERAIKLRGIVAKIKENDMEVIKWLKSDQKCLTIELPPLGNLYRSKPGLVSLLKEHRDKFKRHVALPVELWEVAGNTVCSVDLGGVIHECVHI